MAVREDLDPAVLIQLKELNDALQQAVEQARTLEKRYRQMQGRRAPASPTYQ